jgi:biotin synthase-like enzyme
MDQIERDAIERGGVTEDCSFCGHEFAVALQGVRARGFCSKDCENAEDAKQEASTGCTCRTSGRHMCPFHGDPS